MDPVHSLIQKLLYSTTTDFKSFRLPAIVLIIHLSGCMTTNEALYPPLSVAQSSPHFLV